MLLVSRHHFVSSHVRLIVMSVIKSSYKKSYQFKLLFIYLCKCCVLLWLAGIFFNLIPLLIQVVVFFSVYRFPSWKMTRIKFLSFVMSIHLDFCHRHVHSCCTGENQEELMSKHLTQFDIPKDFAHAGASAIYYYYY